METFVYAPPPPGPLPVLYEDDALLALNKPEGLLSVPGRLTAHRDSLYSRVLEQHPQAMVVHRLDLATSGVLVMAKNLEANRALSRQFQQRSVQKTYLAIVEGTPAQAAGRVDLPLICDWPNRPDKWWITPLENRLKPSGPPLARMTLRGKPAHGLSYVR